MDEHQALGGGPGSLTIADTRTGLEFELEIKQGGIVLAKEMVNKATAQDGDLLLFDPGYFNTAVTKFAISLANGNDGTLKFRGYPVEELAQHCTFLQVAYLLIYGDLASKAKLSRFEDSVRKETCCHKGVLGLIKSQPKNAHAMGLLATAISSMSSFYPQPDGAYQDKHVQDQLIARVLGQIPIYIAHIFQHAEGMVLPNPSSELPYVANFRYMHIKLVSLFPRSSPLLARILERLLIVHMEHELSCSSAAIRHLVSWQVGVDLYTCLAAGVATLGGPFHGAANEACANMIQEIGTVDNIPAYLEAVKNKKKKLFGFGHRIHKAYEIRVKVIRQLAEDAFEIVGHDPLIKVSDALAEAALSDEYFIKRKLYPNIDFYSWIVFKALGFQGNFPLLFALARVVGYLAHWKECLDLRDNKIVRPRQLYIGEWLQHY
ncbi:hypothetical protein SELMODRAFT_109043 [Selaginella moellendorffii]|uniref:Citrate synthase n=1 Tax=Selaginella moellendorffii TaxID=88036 RepID=D8S4X8_SELML|nr:hypothetical protein SELMODRAFT_109043 [Selaginella moellendorffii]